MVDYTPILKLVQPDFDQTPWDEDINGDLAIIDATIGRLFADPNMTGIWRNDTTYAIGQIAVDVADSSMWTCAVMHTTASAPTTFAQERTTSPTYWTTNAAPIAGYLPISGGTINGPLTVTGNVTLYSTNWLTPLVSWPLQSSRVQALSSTGQIALLGASQSTNGGDDTIGIAGFGFNNKVSGFAWGGYFEGRQYSQPTTHATMGIEVGIANVSGTDAGYPTPYAFPQPASIGVEVESGAGVTHDTPPLTPRLASAGIYVGGNDARFQVGLLFGNSAINGTDGLGTGTATAISMAAGHTIAWIKPDNTNGPGISSLQTTGTPVDLVFTNNTATFASPTAEGVLLSVYGGGLSAIGNETSLSLLVRNNAGVHLVQVTLGAPDSGGAGFRALRVAN